MIMVAVNVFCTEVSGNKLEAEKCISKHPQAPNTMLRMKYAKSYLALKYDTGIMPIFENEQMLNRLAFKISLNGWLLEELAHRRNLS